ncbi:MAG: hypothetical protein ACREBG_09195 [Pyrinomonadaceae bacterium]
MATTTSTAKTLTAAVCVLFAAAGFCSAKAWRDIVPLHSTCEDVKRILNVSECGSSYDTNEGRVDISFSRKPCADGWNVPPGTVLHIAVTLKAPQRLDQLGLDLATFKKEVSYDSPNYVAYTNREEGITLSGTSDGKVDRIDYYAASKDEYLRYPDSLVKQSAGSNGDPQSTHKFDQYGDLTITNEQERLDDFVRQLTREVEQIYIIVYAGRRAHIGEAQARAARVKDYLVKVRGIDQERIVTVDGGYRERLTVELFGRLKGGATPTASPTVCPSEVKLIAGSRVSR